MAAESKRLAETAAPTSATPRWGTRSVEIVQVRLTNAKGVDQNIFETGEPLVLLMRYETHGSVASPIFGLAIHRHDGVHVTGPNTSFAGLNLPTLNKPGTITFTVPSLPLLPGLYEISVAVVRHRKRQ